MREAPPWTLIHHLSKLKTFRVAVTSGFRVRAHTGFKCLSFDAELQAWELSVVSVLAGWKEEEQSPCGISPTSCDYKLSGVLMFYLMVSPGSAGGERRPRFVRCDESAAWLAELKRNSLTSWTWSPLSTAVKCKPTVAADLRHCRFSLELWLFWCI